MIEKNESSFRQFMWELKRIWKDSALYRRIEYHNAKIYLEQLDIEKLTKKSKAVMKMCVNEPICGDTMLFHHLPIKGDLKRKFLDYQNPEYWNLSDKQKQFIINTFKELAAYTNAVYTLVNCRYDGKACGCGCYGDKGNYQIVKGKILPTWFAFPTIDRRSIHWRMGIGEAYEEIFENYLEYLRWNERKEYVKKYPLPKYFVNQADKFAIDLYYKGYVAAMMNDYERANKPKPKSSNNSHCD